jgi:hypothetical protein
MDSPDTVPVAYETPREWLEGKRRFVQVLRQLCGGRCDDWRSRRGGPSGTDREVLEAALNWHEEQHEFRVIATHAAGIKLPIEDFAAEFELDEVEREIVELLLVEETDLTHDDVRGLQVGELVHLLSRGKQEKAQDYLPYFLPGSHLSTVIKDREGYGSRRLSIGDDMVGVLLGVQCRKTQASARPAAAATESWHGDISEFLTECHIVLSASTLESIRALWGFVRREEVINKEWGFGSLEQLPSGVCLLFHGPSGTGKTMTARCLCRALGHEPMVVSYADLISKWVGDTEKNTKATFAEAAKTGKVLVFDEADAVFARRTEVRHSTDRFANGEVNTLLMELERFSGIVILTTNHAGVLDPALERRIRYKVFFGVPDMGARVEIWRQHLPDAVPVGADVDIERLAKEFDLTGGQIANAVLTAASLAASRLEEGSTAGQIMMADFEAAAQREQNGYNGEGSNRRLGF